MLNRWTGFFRVARIVIPLSVAVSLLLLSCGGGGGTSAPTPGSGTPTPPVGEIIVPVVGSSRMITPEFNSYNFNVLRVASDVENPALIAGLRALNAGSLRVPGGTPGEYWDWQRGGIRLGPYPGLPGPAPFGDDILAISGLTPPVIDRLLDNVGTPALFTANVLTASLDENLTDIAAFRALGQPITRIALGNEEYFRLPNPAARFPSARAYGDLAREWAGRFRLEAPTARLAVIAPSPLRNTGITFEDWIAGLDSAAVWPAVDAVAIHPYFDTTALRPLSSPASGEAMIAAMIAHDNDYLSRATARIPASKSIWVTEWNVFEEEAVAVSGGSWLTAVANLDRAVNFLSNPRVELSSMHVAVGNRQWSALTDASGRALDYADGRPVVIVGAPFTLTANGEAMALLGAATRGGGSAQSLDLGAASGGRVLVGARIASTDGRVRDILVNGRATSVRVQTNGRVLLLTAQFDRGTVATQTLQRSSFFTADNLVTLPPFSAALIERP